MLENQHIPNPDQEQEKKTEREAPEIWYFIPATTDVNGKVTITEPPPYRTLP